MSELAQIVMIMGVALFGYGVGWYLRGTVLPPAVSRSTVERIVRDKQREILGQCELCADPAAGNVHEIDEAGGWRTIRLCRGHFVEAVNYHTARRIE